MMDAYQFRRHMSKRSLSFWPNTTGLGKQRQSIFDGSVSVTAGMFLKSFAMPHKLSTPIETTFITSMRALCRITSYCKFELEIASKLYT